MKTQISRLFNELNRRYWRARLPRYRVIRVRSIGKKAKYIGFCNNRTKTILLDASLNGNELRETLIHEMCHIGMPKDYGHGPIFQRKLRRLARLGECGMRDDLKCYDGTIAEEYLEKIRAQGREIGPEIPFRTVIESDLDSYASEYWRKRWDTIRRVIAAQYDLTPLQLQRLAPGAEKQWRRLSLDYRHIEKHRLALQNTLHNERQRPRTR